MAKAAVMRVPLYDLAHPGGQRSAHADGRDAVALAGVAARRPSLAGADRSARGFPRSGWLVVIERGDRVTAAQYLWRLREVPRFRTGPSASARGCGTPRKQLARRLSRPRRRPAPGSRCGFLVWTGHDLWPRCRRRSRRTAPASSPRTPSAAPAPGYPDRHIRTTGRPITGGNLWPADGNQDPSAPAPAHELERCQG